MATVTIDEQRIPVKPGMTILDAARSVAIEIPTLCHVEGLEPASSCFMCAVQIEGRPNLSPACGMPVADGMVVSTNSEDVRATRKMAVELLLSDHSGDCIAPCRATCPAGLDIPGFVYELATGRKRAGSSPTRFSPERRAMEVIAKTLVLPGALGRICPRLCEEECRRCDLDEGLAIGALHRFAADRDLESEPPYLPARSARTGRTVAIVGAGPAGLSAAYYLLQKGHGCTLFDAHPLPGGMLRYGIPEFRLPNDALDAEIDAVTRLGAHFHMNSRWGHDFTITGLREDYDAVFLAIGAQGTQSLGCPGAEQAVSAIDFLERAAGGDPIHVGATVIVVGGGNTAMDTARTAVRMGAEQVTVLYRRTRREMPCLTEETENAEAEGVEIEYLVAPSKLERTDNGWSHLTCVRMQLGEPDDSGRARPVPIDGSEFMIEANTVITAIGQMVDRSLATREGLEVTAWGIATDSKTLATNLPGVFAGGDAVCGPDLAVRAVAAGRHAAVSIDQYLGDRPVTGDPEITNVLMRGLNDEELAALFRQIEKTPRAGGHRIDDQRRRTSFDEIEAGLTDAEAVREAQRCLSCGCRKVDTCRLRQYATDYQADPYRFRGERRRFAQDLSHPDIVYEPGKCILCDACVRIAAEAEETLGVATIGRGFNVAIAVPFDEPLAKGLEQVARRCAEVCPTGALALRTERSCDACRFNAADGCARPESWTV